MNTLLIGCGNIGALYDYDSTEITTYAKALFVLNYKVDFIEPNDEISKKIQDKYNFTRRDYSNLDLSNYNLLIISTPTQYHSEYLIDAIKSGVSLIICEKPIAYTINELDLILQEYKNNKSKVVVNYIRRFQGHYEKLKNNILVFKEPLTSIHCNYYKGILNYASHALDTIQFLTGFILETDGIYELDRVYDYFTEDPTISFAGKQNNVEFFFRGLQVDYPIFEIDLMFKYYRIKLSDGGAISETFYKNNLIKRDFGLIDNYMLNVINKSKKIIENKNSKDNFIKSLELNKTLIKLINI